MPLLEELEEFVLPANMFITDVLTVDGGNNPITPQAGEPFWIRVEYQYDNPIDGFYTISRVVNNNPVHTAPPVDFGTGLTGSTFWFHYWGAWVMHKSGTYDVTVTLDSENDIPETDETDNTATVQIAIGGTITPEWDLVNAEQGRALLGDGTDVIVGSMDDALDFNHPWLQGNDSLGRPRLVGALQNSLGAGGSPINAAHATPVMGIVLAKGANDGDITGLAPDARYVSAEFIDRASAGHGVVDVRDAGGFMVENGAEVVNMSWSWWFNTSLSENGEDLVNLMVDYMAYAHNIVAVPAVNQLAVPGPTSPGSSRNVITVGGLESTLQFAWDQQNYGPTADGRSKPDLIGNAAVDAVAPSANWQSGFLATSGFVGTSFSAPFVTGAAAQMIGYGKQNGENVDHRVIKAVIMNSGVKGFDDDGSPWSHSSTQPLDDQQGTGILDLVRVYEMYSAGEQSPGFVDQAGYDFGTIQGVAGAMTDPTGRMVYKLGRPVDPSAGLDVTLAWDRHTFWNDVNGSGSIDAGDSFFTSPADAQDNLDLILYRDGVEVIRSESMVDNVEHLHVSNLPDGDYELHVVRRDVLNSGSGEEYALAWHSTTPWEQPLDFGDAPDPLYQTLLANDGARHTTQGPTLGIERDGEVDGQPTINANGDDMNLTPDDEDGVILSTYQHGQTNATATINVQNAPSGALLDAWIDFSGDGFWDDPGEQIANSVFVTNGPNIITFPVPIDSVSSTYARFRLSTTGDLDPTGPAGDGEVEDYRVSIHPPQIDLIGTSFDATPDHVLRGQTNVEFTITNAGADDTFSSFDVHIVLSVDGVIGNGDDVIVPGSAVTISSLAMGASDTRTVSLQLDQAVLFNQALAANPIGQGVGFMSSEELTLGLVIDPGHVITETNENNNFNQGQGIDEDNITYFPWDLDGSGQVEPLDALFAIQQVGTSHPDVDFDGNGTVTSQEALSAVQRIGYMRNEAVVEPIQSPEGLNGGRTVGFSPGLSTLPRVSRSALDVVFSQERSRSVVLNSEPPRAKERSSRLPSDRVVEEEPSLSSESRFDTTKHDVEVGSKELGLDDGVSRARIDPSMERMLRRK